MELLVRLEQREQATEGEHDDADDEAREVTLTPVTERVILVRVLLGLLAADETRERTVWDNLLLLFVSTPFCSPLTSLQFEAYIFSLSLFAPFSTYKATRYIPLRRTLLLVLFSGVHGWLNALIIGISNVNG